MSLNPAMIYRRTDRGVREVYEKSHQFTQSERLILILLDGRLNVSGLQARLPSLNDERIERALGKLQETGLVEPMGSLDAIKATGLVPEIARLEPEAVAHFLEQTELDPVTVFGATEDEVNSELVRASVERAAAQLAHESAGTAVDAPPASVRQRSTGRESVRTHSTVAPVSPAAPESDWDVTEATQFAITTVNVPDRLDLQEERDRAEMEDYAEERRQLNLRLWMKRLLVVAVVAVIGAVLYGTLKPLREDTSPASVSERLGIAFKQPVRIAETQFRFSPSPRLVIRGLDVGGQFGADEVSLLINWKDLWAALRGGQWVWGEATVAPVTMNSAQALAAVKTIPAAAHELPAKISTVRFESIRISDSRLFPARYEGVLRRTDDGSFGPLTLKQLDADDGALQMQFRGGRAGAIDFALAGERWLPPIGPRVRWNEVRASGRIDGTAIEVSNFTLAGFFGVITGSASASRGAEWTLAGAANGSNIDVESVMQSLRPQTKGAADAKGLTELPVAPAQGTAALKLSITARGATLDDALANTVVTGPFQIRFATLNGINMGLAATQGATAAGTTRFSEFEGTLSASASGIRLEDVSGRAGAMATRGTVEVAQDLSLSGSVRVELGGQTVQAPITLRVGGTALDPRFVRRSD